MKKKRLTLSAFLYPCSLFVVCFVRVFLMLVCRMCSVSPVDAASWENRDLLQRQNITFVQEWVEESITIPREKFPESMRGEVCLICSLRRVRILTYIQTRVQKCTRTHSQLKKHTLIYDFTHQTKKNRLSHTHTHSSPNFVLIHPVE